MKNKLTDLQNYLFELMEKLKNDDLTGNALDQEIKRSNAFSSLAITAVKNAALITRCADIYGLPAIGDLPLLPESPEKPVIPKPETGSKQRSLLRNKDEDYG